MSSIGNIKGVWIFNPLPRYFTDGSLQLETEALAAAEVGVVGEVVMSVLILDLEV